MHSEQSNPYESPASGRPKAEASSANEGRWRASYATWALVIATTCIVGFYVIVQWLLSVGWWDRFGQELGTSLHNAVHIGSIPIYLIGLFACVVCAVLGTWFHRIAVIPIGLAYLPFLQSMLRWIGNRIVELL